MLSLFVCVLGGYTRTYTAPPRASRKYCALGQYGLYQWSTASLTTDGEFEDRTCIHFSHIFTGPHACLDSVSALEEQRWYIDCGNGTRVFLPQRQPGSILSHLESSSGNVSLPP